jgi:hypothetical protein
LQQVANIQGNGERFLQGIIQEGFVQSRDMTIISCITGGFEPTERFSAENIAEKVIKKTFVAV